MVLLKNKNYDYSSEIKRTILNNILAATTDILLDTVENIEINSYLLINPGFNTSEIVKVSAKVDNSKLTIEATKYQHSMNENVFLVPYNQIKIYTSSESTGTYLLVDTVDMVFNSLHTNHYYDVDNDYYYKSTFYNSTTSEESNIDDANAWQITDDELYCSEQDLRMFLQFEIDDYPTQEGARFFIKTAMVKIDLDISTSNKNILWLSTLLLSKFYVLRGLATRALSKGYIQIVVEGRTITKAYQEMVLEAENILQEYKEFINAQDRTEAISTNPLFSSGAVDSLTIQDLVDLMNGISNAETLERGRWFRRYWRSGR